MIPNHFLDFLEEFLFFFSSFEERTRFGEVLGVTLLTRKTLQMVDVRPRPHHHLEGWDGFVTGRAMASESKQSVTNRKTKGLIDTIVSYCCKKLRKWGI